MALVRVRLLCENKEEHSDGTWQVRFAVCQEDDDAEANKEFFGDTPWGSFEVGNLNKATADKFDTECDYFLELDDPPDEASDEPGDPSSPEPGSEAQVS